MVAESNVSSGSTTWEWRKVRVRSGAAPAGDSANAVSTSRFRVPRSRRKPIWIEVKYHGGPESSWVFSYRGLTTRFPGWMALEDALSQVQGEER